MKTKKSIRLIFGKTIYYAVIVKYQPLFQFIINKNKFDEPLLVRFVIIKKHLIVKVSQNNDEVIEIFFLVKGTTPMSIIHRCFWKLSPLYCYLNLQI